MVDRLCGRAWLRREFILKGRVIENNGAGLNYIYKRRLMMPKYTSNIMIEGRRKLNKYKCK